MAATAGPAPDFKGGAEQTAASQNQQVLQQTQANRANSASPFAQESWTQGADGSWQRSLGLAGGLGQGAANLGNEFGAATSKPLDPGLFGGVANGQEARDQAIDAEFGQAMSRLNPQLDRQDAAARTRMANMGLDPHGQAARTQNEELRLGRNDATTSALNRAIGSGREAGQAVFGQNMMAHQQAIADALKQRQAPLEMMGQMQSFLNQPGYNQAGMGMGTDYFGAMNATGQWDRQNAEMQNQFWSDLAGGAMAAAGSAAKFSDERLKLDVERLPMEAIPGVPLATWTWQDGTLDIGVIAQDLAKVAPQFVHVGPQGFLLVDYSFLWRGIGHGEQPN